MEPVANPVARARDAKTAAGAVTAKAESKTIAADNPTRVSLTISNDGEKTVYIAKGKTAEAHKGITLKATDPPLVIDDYTGIVTCITAAGESIVTFSEV